MRARHALAWTLLLGAPVAGAQEMADKAGGFVLAEAQHVSVRGAPLKDDNFLGIADNTVGVAALLEGSIRGVSWRTRFEAARSDPAGQGWRSSAVLQELNRVFSLGDNTTLSVGKRIYSMDQSYANQPLGFFQKRTDLSDPTDSLANAEGLPMVLLSWVGAHASAAAVYSKDIGNEADGFNRGVEQFIVKFGYEFERVSTTFLLRRASGESHGFGATVSGTAGEALSYYGSYYEARGTQRPILAGLFNPGAGAGVPGFYRTNDGVRYPRATVGMVYSSRDLPKLQVEYSYDRRGLSDRQYADFAGLIADAPDGFPGKVQRAVAAQMLLPQGMRRHYIDVNLAYSFHDWEFSGGVYAGVADWSRTWYGSAKCALTPRSTFMLSAVAQEGPAQSERALSPVEASVAARFQYRF